jgi:hypothetical protein
MNDPLAEYANSRECLFCGKEWVQVCEQCPKCGGLTAPHSKQGEKLRVWGEMLQGFLEKGFSADSGIMHSPVFQQLYEASHYMQIEGKRQVANESKEPFKLILGGKDTGD